MEPILQDLFPKIPGSAGLAAAPVVIVFLLTFLMSALDCTNRILHCIFAAASFATPTA